eukprot:2589551-Prymnesium_polylepis.1
MRWNETVGLDLETPLRLFRFRKARGKCCVPAPNEDPPPMHRGRPVESRSTVPRFHTELVPC